jgi:hypothetical protein
MTLGALDLPALESLAVETGGLDRASLGSILAARWPRLSRLELWFGSPDYGAECDAADLAPLLAGPPPGLTHLGLRNAIFTDELVDLLHDSKALAQVRSLDLSLGCLTSAGARSLLSHAARYRHLESLDLSNNCLEDVSGLAELCKSARLEGQRPDRVDEDRRYPSVGE